MNGYVGYMSGTEGGESMVKVCNVCNKETAHKTWKANNCIECTSNGIKWCPGCCTAHAISNFHKNGNTLRNLCKACEINRCKGRVYTIEQKKVRTVQSTASKRKRYAEDEEYRNKEKQRCRVREATKEQRGYYSLDEWYKVFAYFNCQCAYCGSSTSITKEHIVPLVKGGSNTIENIIPACLTCNCSKQDFELIEWYTKQLFYSKESLDKILYWTKGGGAHVI